MADYPAATTDVPEGFHVDFEVLAVSGEALLVRFKINDKHFDFVTHWDGTGDVIEALKKLAPSAVSQFLRPPPVPFDKLQEQVGKQGHVDIPRPM